MGAGSQTFIKELARQEPHMVESYAPVPNALVRGEAQVGITYVKYVKQFKGPLGFVMLNKFLADSNYVGLSAKSPNPNAARLYIEYVTSAEGQKAIAEEAEFVLYPGVNPDIPDADKVTTRTIFMDSPTNAEFKQLSQQFRDLFFGK